MKTTSRHTDEQKRRYYEHFFSEQPAPRLEELTEQDFDRMADTTAGAAIRVGMAMNSVSIAIIASAEPFMKAMRTIVAAMKLWHIRSGYIIQNRRGRNKLVLLLKSGKSRR